MKRISLKRDLELTARLEARALERMLAALCEHSRQLLAEAESRGALGSRESKLQVKAFAERCAQADALLRQQGESMDEVRLARIERLIGALECSRTYFRDVHAAAQHRSLRTGQSLLRRVADGIRFPPVLGSRALAGLGRAAAAWRPSAR